MDSVIQKKKIKTVEEGESYHKIILINNYDIIIWKYDLRIYYIFPNIS